MFLQRLSLEWLADYISADNWRWLRIGLIPAVLLLAAAVPAVFPERLFLLALVAVPAVVGVLALLRWPGLGILGLMITAVLVPSPGLPGGLNLAVLLLIMIVVLWIFGMVTQKRLRLVKSRTTVPLLLLLVAAVLSFGFGQFPWFSYAPKAPLDAQIGGFLIVLLLLGLFLVVAQQVQDLRWLQLITWLGIGLSAVFILGWIVGPIGSIAGRIYQGGATNNSMFWMWPVALAFGQALFNTKLKWWGRVVFLLTAVMIVFVGYYMNREWKSSYLPAFAAVAAIVAARSWKLALVVGLIGIVPALFLAREAIATDDYSYSTRIDAWIIMLDIIKESPLFGLGPANYYWYTPLFRIRGYAVQFNSHNQYLDIVAQMGLVGMACFVWFVAEIGRLGLSLRNRAPEGFARGYVYGVLGGLAGMLVAGTLVDWIFPFVYNIGLTGMRGSMLAWIFLGGLVSIEQVTRRRAREAAANKTEQLEESEGVKA